MAAASAPKDKENAAPPASGATASAAAVSRRHGYGVKSCCGVKKRPSRSRARWLGRVPLRDITNLIEAPLGQEVPPAAATEVTEPDVVARVAVLLGGGDAAGPARYSLRKGFR